MIVGGRKTMFASSKRCFGRVSPSGLNAIVISSSAPGEEVFGGVEVGHDKYFPGKNKKTAMFLSWMTLFPEKKTFSQIKQKQVGRNHPTSIHPLAKVVVFSRLPGGFFEHFYSL